MNTYAILITTDSSQLEKLQQLVTQAKSITLKKFFGDKDEIEAKVVGLVQYMLDEGDDEDRKS